MFTGLYPRNHGLTVNGMALNPKIPTLPAMLSAAGYRTHGVGKHHLQPILAPADRGMPESTAFWESAASDSWNGPYYGLQTVEFVIGEADQAYDSGGHYSRWLDENHPEAIHLLKAKASLSEIPSDLDEVWQSAIPAELHYNTWITDRAINYIDGVDDSFFLFVSYPDPHHPFAPPKPYCDLFSPEHVPMPRVVSNELAHMPAYYQEAYSPGTTSLLQTYWGLPDDAEQGLLIQTRDLNKKSIQLAIAHTYGMVTMIDDGVGRILEALQRRDLVDDTVIIFTSDHGELLGDHGLMHKGSPAYRQLREVPFIMKGPQIPRGKVSSCLTSHIDLMPTLLDMANVKMENERLDGHTLTSVFNGNSSCYRDTVYSEYHPRSKKAELYNQTIQSKKWRLTIYPNNSQWGELFDLEKDPFEHKNLYSDAKYKTVVRRLKQNLNNDFPSQPTINNERICKW